jgi:hypothetical protein
MSADDGDVAEIVNVFESIMLELSERQPSLAAPHLVAAQLVVAYELDVIRERLEDLEETLDQGLRTAGEGI